VLVTRHGDRVPVDHLYIPGDTLEWNCTLNQQYAEASDPTFSVPKRVFQKTYIRGREILPGNCLLGQLTERGAQQHRDLGRSFRSIYVQKLGFLSPTHAKWNEMYVRSTDIERTLLSAYNFLQGLYPATDPHAVQVFTMDNDLDNGWPNTVLCPALQRVQYQIQNATNFTTFYEQNLAPLAARWGSAWGLSLTLDDMRTLNDILRSRVCHGLPLLPGVELPDAQKLFLGTRVLDNMVSQPFLARKFGSGSFLADLFAALVSKARFSLFSAHDDTCRSLLFALYAGETDVSGLLVRILCYFCSVSQLLSLDASHVTLELWREDSSGNQFVALQYNGQALQMLSPCSDLFCRLQDFTALVNSYAVTAAECQ
jgi:hypothetical protein